MIALWLHPVGNCYKVDWCWHPRFGVQSDSGQPRAAYNPLLQGSVRQGQHRNLGFCPGSINTTGMATSMGRTMVTLHGYQSPDRKSLQRSAVPDQNPYWCCSNSMPAFVWEPFARSQLTERDRGHCLLFLPPMETRYAYPNVMCRQAASRLCRYARIVVGNPVTMQKSLSKLVPVW